MITIDWLQISLYTNPGFKNISIRHLVWLFLLLPLTICIESFFVWQWMATWLKKKKTYLFLILDRRTSNSTIMLCCTKAFLLNQLLLGQFVTLKYPVQTPKPWFLSQQVPLSDVALHCNRPGINWWQSINHSCYRRLLLLILSKRLFFISKWRRSPDLTSMCNGQ